MLAKPWISCLCAPTDLLKMSMSLSSNFHGIGDSPANVEFTDLLVNLHHFLAAFSIFGRAVLAEIAWDILGKLLLEYLQCHYGEVKNKIGGFQHYIVEWFMVLWYSYLFVVDFISLKNVNVKFSFKLFLNVRNVHETLMAFKSGASHVLIHLCHFTALFEELLQLKAASLNLMNNWTIFG